MFLIYLYYFYTTYIIIIIIIIIIGASPYPIIGVTPSSMRLPTFLPFTAENGILTGQTQWMKHCTGLVF